MKILLVSGFLGAGKTTFIKYMAKRLQRRFVILENEYGDVNIDKNELAASSESIWEMTEGCICCSMKGDFALSVLTIANSLEPDYLVVEPTGVGQLSSILDNLKKIEYERIEVLAPITLVDTQAFELTKESFDAFFIDQLRYAGTVLLTKQENLPPDAIASVAKDIRSLRDKRADTVIETHYQELEDGFFTRLLNRHWQEESLEMPEAAPPLENFTYEGFTLPSEETLYSLASYLLSGRLGDVYRVKGYIPFASGDAAKFDFVAGKLDVAPAKEKEGVLVFIGSNLAHQDLDAFFMHYGGHRHHGHHEHHHHA